MPRQEACFSRAHLLDARERPLGRFRKQLIALSGQPLEGFTDASVDGGAGADPGVAERDAGVAQEAAPLGALDRASTEKPAKLRFAQSEKPFKPWI